jgi:hypothetical protein
LEPRIAPCRIDQSVDPERGLLQRLRVHLWPPTPPYETNRHRLVRFASACAAILILCVSALVVYRILHPTPPEDQPSVFPPPPVLKSMRRPEEWIPN